MRKLWHLNPAEEDAVLFLSQEFQLPDIAARILVGRGITDRKSANRFLEKSIHDLPSPETLSGMDRAVERLVLAAKKSESILIHGDFDADGITSTAVLTLFLQDLGLRVSPFLPNRLQEGHGISLRALDLAKEENAKLLITCDCGTSSRKEIEALRASGIETIVTDHHAVPEELPENAILLNPKLPNSFEGAEVSEELSGVGVVFMLCIALRARLRVEGFFSSSPEPNLKKYLDIVALGTLADMAPLRGPNRILVAHGLDLLQTSQRPGIAALRTHSGLGSASVIRSEDVGFRLAPRINAAARLGHADDALALLLTSDTAKAESLAQKLDGWNEERKGLQAKMMRMVEVEAISQAAAGRKGVVVESTAFHPGIVGLVAQKLAEITGLPCMVFALDGDLAKGSGRSRGGVNLVKALEECSHLLQGYGGHEEAGGCTLDLKQLSVFKKEFNAALGQQSYSATRKILIDGKLEFRHLNQGLLASMDRLRPYGIGNPEPVLWASANVYGAPREVGVDHLQVMLKDEGTKESGFIRGIGFRKWKTLQSVMRGAVDILYTPSISEWKGKREIQVRIEDAQGAGHFEGQP